MKKRKKIIVVALGMLFEKYRKEIEMEYEIIAVFDNFIVEGQYKEYRCTNMHEIASLSYDYVIICSFRHYNELRQQMLYCKVSAEKICGLDKLIYKVNPEKRQEVDELKKRYQIYDKAYQTVCYRPMKAESVSRYSKYCIKEKIGIVLQGPIKYEDDFTLETVKLYKKLYPECLIIISTWYDEKEKMKLFIDENVIIVYSDLPEERGIANINCQIVSTCRGIEMAKKQGCTYICKSRTDQRIYAPDVFYFMNGLIKMFPVQLECNAIERIVVCNFGTNSGKKYYITDIFLYGRVEDMMRYFSCPLNYRKIESVNKEDEIEMSLCTIPEVYLTSNYLRNLGFDLKWTLEDSDFYRNQLYIVVDTEILDWYWPKYTNLEYRDRKYQYDVVNTVTFRDWLCDQL